MLFHWKGHICVKAWLVMLAKVGGFGYKLLIWPKLDQLILASSISIHHRDCREGRFQLPDVSIWKAKEIENHMLKSQYWASDFSNGE